MEHWLQEPRTVALLALAALPLLWLAAGWALRWFERRVARAENRGEALARGRVTRPFVWDEAEGEHRGRVRIGVELWKARCSAGEAEQIRVGDRVWLRRHGTLFQVDRTERARDR